jgi:hypothetical protein
MNVRGGSKLDADAGSIFNADLQVISEITNAGAAGKLRISRCCIQKRFNLFHLIYNE